ncbi:hypothetical protein RCH10_005079 [Variovorax sp. GrIS 2.14]|uniref:hypothetical protein n=1 Tax=Variovorax sp. GrIS 2.14 TaxID=3071709 RepID=UPI0038F69DD3
MSNATNKTKVASATNDNPLPLNVLPGETRAHAKARAMVLPSINAAMVIEAFEGNLLGKDTSLEGLVESLRDSMDRTKGGDLSTVEAMLVGQATALQTIFVSLARRAQLQQSQRNLEAFLGLALKVQAQSRATITALVDLKFPRQQATFVKQANIAAGNQQVNNGGVPKSTREGAHTHGKETASVQNKLLEADHGQPGGWVDRGPAATATRGDSAMEAVVKVHRPDEPRR